MLRVQLIWRAGLAALLLGLVVGAVDGIASSSRVGVSVARGALAGAGAIGCLAFFAGALWASVQVVLAPLTRALGLDARWQRATSSSSSDDRRPVAALHATVGIVVLSIGLALGLHAVFTYSTQSVQVTEMLNALGLAAFVGCALSALLLHKVLFAPLTRLFLKIDRRVRLPWPRPASLQWALFVCVPVALTCVPLLLEFGASLSYLAWGLALLVVLAAVGLATRLFSDLARVRVFSRISLRGRIAAGVPAIGLALAGLVSLATWSAVTQFAAGGLLSPLAVRALRVASDWDSDGFSSWFGGGDCAPFDSRRSPAARDVPGNQIDENCDGRDAERVTTQQKLGTFYGRLSGKQRRHYNVLWVVVDALRAKSMSVYGHEHQTTPHLEALAKDAWVFENATSQASNTSLSMPSMFSGLNPGSLSWRQGRSYPQPKGEVRTLPDTLSELGYDASISVNDAVKLRLPALLSGYERILTSPKSVRWRSGAYTVLNTIAAIERAQAAKKPFMITAHFDDAHQPYRGGKGFALPAFSHEEKHLEEYERGIAAVDQYFFQLTTYLRAERLLDDTILVVTADHGEEFWEHGNDHHSESCYAESVHVPLIVRVPGFEPARISAPVALIDIVPTLLELIGAPTTGVELDGQSLLLPVLAPNEVPPERPVFCWIYQVFKARPDFFVRAVRSDGFSYFESVLQGRKELYDLTKDPAEVENLLESGAHGSEAARLQELLEAASKSNIFEARTHN